MRWAVGLNRQSAHSRPAQLCGKLQLLLQCGDSALSCLREESCHFAKAFLNLREVERLISYRRLVTPRTMLELPPPSDFELHRGTAGEARGGGGEVRTTAGVAGRDRRRSPPEWRTKSGRLPRPGLRAKHAGERTKPAEVEGEARSGYG